MGAPPRRATSPSPTRTSAFPISWRSTTSERSWRRFSPDPSVAKVGQNLKYDSHILRRHGMPVSGWTLDTMVAAFLLEPDRPTFNMDSLAAFYLGHETIKYASLVGTGARQLTLDQIDVVARDALRRRGRRRHAAARGRARPEAPRGGRRGGLAHDRRADPADPRAHGGDGHQDRRRRARARSPRRWTRSSTTSDGRSTRWPAGRSTSIRRSSCARCCSARSG